MRSRADPDAGPYYTIVEVCTASPYIPHALSCTWQLGSQVMPCIDSIDDRRALIAAEENGLAFGLSHFHHSMKQKECRAIGVPGAQIRKMDHPPFDVPAMHTYKLWVAQIHEIEAMGIVVPYNSPTDWK